MTGIFRRMFAFTADNRGNVGLLFALTAIPVAGVTGIAVDYGRATHASSHMQQAADSAALAAANKGSLSSSDRINLAANIFKANMTSSAFISPPTPKVTIENGNVTVTASAAVPTTFMQIMGFKSMPIEASSVAQEASSDVSSNTAKGPACLLTLNATEQWGITMNGDTSISANCGIFSNNSTSTSIRVNGDGSMSSTYTAVVGKYNGHQHFTFSPKPVEGAKALADPFAGKLVAPEIPEKCGFKNKRVKGNDDGDDAILEPGYYCGGIDIQSDAKVTFKAGTYIISGGQFNIGSHATAKGDGVFFYLKGGNARIEFGSHAEIEFRAPTSGTYKGMLIWADEWLSNAHRFGCHSESILEGAIYSPGAEIDIQSSGEVGASADWTVWVVRSLQLSSHAKLKITNNYAGSSTPVPDGLIAALTYTPEPTVSRPARLRP